LLAGRTLTVAEISRADRVTLINEAAAKLWPEGQNPIGKRVHIDFLERSQGAPLAPGVGGTADVTVVGILRNTRNAGLRNPPAPAAFLPYTVTAPTGRALAIRSQGPNPLSLLGSLREHMRQLDPELPLNRPISMTDVMGENTKQPRFNMALFSFFGGLGLSLAVIGLFSVLSYIVVRRTHEIGVRMALGADRMHVLTLMLSIGAKLVLTGLGIGLAGSIALGFGTNPIAVGASPNGYYRAGSRTDLNFLSTDFRTLGGQTNQGLALKLYVADAAAVPEPGTFLLAAGALTLVACKLRLR
jgi:putative ABC transport system permease protein